MPNTGYSLTPSAPSTQPLPCALSATQVTTSFLGICCRGRHERDGNYEQILVIQRIATHIDNDAPSDLELGRWNAFLVALHECAFLQVEHEPFAKVRVDDQLKVL